MKTILLSLISVAFLGAAACDDGSSGGIALEFQPVGTTTSALTAGSVEVAPGFTVTRLEALITELKLLPDKDPVTEEKEAKFKAKGDFWIDALDPDSSTIPTIPPPAETYKKVEFKFEKVKDSHGIDGTDAAIALDATINGTSVVVRIEKTDKVTLRHVDGIALATGGTSTFLLNLNVPGWFDGVDLSTLTADANGVILIEKETNKDAYATVTANLKATIKLLRKP